MADKTITIWRLTESQIGGLRQLMIDDAMKIATIEGIYFSDEGTLRIAYIDHRYRVDEMKIKDFTNKED